MHHFRTTRRWIGTTGSEERRTTTFTFVLPAAGRVVFAVNQLSPACRGEGRFVVRAHRGLNRVRFSGRLHGRQLGPGTYRISARSANGRLVRRVILVIVPGGAPSREEFEAARSSNTCQGTSTADSTATPTSGQTGAVLASLPTPGPQALPSPAVIHIPKGPNVHSGVLGSVVEKTARAAQPFLLALLAAAILLLGMASLPQAAVPDARMNDMLVRHRLELAGVGAAALVGTVIAFLLA